MIVAGADPACAGVPRGGLRPGGRGHPVRRRGRRRAHRQRQRRTGCPARSGRGDGGRALRVARALEAGTLSINSNSSVRFSTPFGGFKQSGLGREHSMAVLDHYTELKNVFVATALSAGDRVWAHDLIGHRVRP